jgi:hypothetical protein
MCEIAEALHGDYMTARDVMLCTRRFLHSHSVPPEWENRGSSDARRFCIEVLDTDMVAACSRDGFIRHAVFERILPPVHGHHRADSDLRLELR